MEQLPKSTSSPSLQADYQNMKKSLFKTFFRGAVLFVSIISVIDLLRAARSDHPYTFIISASLFAFRAGSLIIIFILKKTQEIFTFIFMLMTYITVLLNHYQGNTHVFENPYSSFHLGVNVSIVEAIVLSQVPQISSRIIYRILLLLARFCIIPLHVKELYLIQFGVILVAIYLDYNQENHDKKLFGSYYYSKEQLAKFKELVTCEIPDGIVILTHDLRKCLFANNSFKALLGEQNFGSYSPSLLQQFQIHQQPSSNEMRTSESTTLLSSLQEFLLEESRMSNTKLSLNLIQSQSQSVFETKAFQLLWDGEPAVVIIFHDITQQNTILELRLAANIQKDRILATVSHELRTPLNSILGMIKIIQDSTQESNTLDYLKVCENSCNLLQSLVNSILDMNLIRFNQLKLDIQKIELHQFLKDITRLFEFQCAEKGIYLTQKLSSSLSKSIVTDKARLSQILINLLGNALKFTMKGEITILAQENIINHEKYLELSVQDTGIGIKEEDHDKLFKMFGKLDKSSNTIVNRHGVGLGLNISNSLSKLLCSNEKLSGIKVQSTYGKGSRFSFMINVDLDQKKSQENDMEEIDYVDIKMKNYSSSPIKHFQPHHKQQQFENNPVIHPLVSRRIPSILIVDDNPLNLFVAEKLVSRQGYNVKTALSGELAIDLFLQNNHSVEPIILILMDLQMPIMDGYMTTTAFRELMQQKKVPEVPIVALTANDTSKDKEMCIKVGMVDMLSKPLRTEDLFGILNSYPKF